MLPGPMWRKEDSSMSSPNSLPTTGFIRLPQILATIPVGKSTWWLGCQTGRYPTPVKLSTRITAWRAQDIHALIERLGAGGKA